MSRQRRMLQTTEQDKPQKKMKTDKQYPRLILMVTQMLTGLERRVEELRTSIMR